MAFNGHTPPVSDGAVAARLEAYLHRIARLQPALNAFIAVATDSARAEARRLENTGSDDLPLAGMVVAVKDNIDVAGMRTTVGSAVYENRSAATEDAVVVRNLRKAGAIIVGKTFLHEFALGQSCVSRTYGICRNPWDLDRVPGGSSGGSAVAVAAELCDAALGTDTGGSIRVPASLNGVSGLRPTFGALSNHGVFPLAPAFDTVGPMARSVSTVAALFAATRESPLREARASDPAHSGRPLGALRVGIPRDFFEDVDEDVERSTDAAIAVLQSLGAECRPVTLSGSAQASSSFGRLLRAEASVVYEGLSREDLDRVDKEVAARLAVGRAITSTERDDLRLRQAAWQRAVSDVFDTGVDLLVMPTTPTVAPKLDDLDGTAFGRLGRITQALSFALLPALSIPSQPSPGGLPIGVQLVGRPMSDDLLLDAGEAFQRVTDWHQLRPPLSL